MTNALVISVALGVLVGQAASQQPRDTPPPRPRDAVAAAIRGRVFNAETGAPVRRAIVTLMSAQSPTPGTPPAAAVQALPTATAAARLGPGGPHGGPRNVATDAAGRFEFTGLSAGSYRLRSMPPRNSGQYLAAAFGSKDSMDPGRLIELKDGEQFDQADIPLRRGGAIVGRLIDDAGEPVSNVMVYPSRVMPGTGSVQRTGGMGFIQSDDHGRYRIFGLEPGDYVVAAEARSMGGPPVEGTDTEGFVTTYHPAAVHDKDAVRVRVRAGMDAEGIDIQLIRTRTFRITGTVMDSQGRALTRPGVMLAKQTPGSGFSSSGSNVEQEGRFTFRDVVPGDYFVIVRPGGLGGPPSSEPSKEPQEHAVVPVSVAADVENLVIVTQPGVSIAGEIVFADGDSPQASDALRVFTQPGNRLPMFGPSPSATVGKDLKFTLSNLFGPVLIRAGLRREWALKAVMLGSTDITDTPVEFKKEHSGHLQIVVSTRPAFVEGTVTGDDGAPVEQAMVVIFPEDKDGWRAGSPRMRITGSMKDGKYTTTGLIGGRYYAVAVPFRTLALTPDTPPEIFEALARDATRLVVAQDEKRVVDLRLSKPPQ